MLPAVSEFVPLPLAAVPIGLKTGATVRPFLSATRTPDRIAETAKDFEATFLSLLLKEMRQTLDTEGGGGLFAGDTGDVQGGLFDLYLGKHLADAGGVGFAPAIERQLRYTTNARPVAPPARASLAGPTSG